MRKWLGLALAVALVAAPAFAQAPTGRVALSLSVGGRGDLSFNDMAFRGAEQAAEDFGWTLVEVANATVGDFLPNLRMLARAGEYDLIISIGFLQRDALTQVAEEFPNQKFALIDSVVEAPNVMSVVFRENEMSALVGALGGMLAVHFEKPYVGMVLGIEIPVLYRFEAGYRFGIDWGVERARVQMGLDARPNVGLLWVYTGTFRDVPKGKAAAEAQLALGAVATYNVAGALGIGMLEAVTEWHAARGTRQGPPFFFGVDANQDYLGRGLHGLASGMKRIDRAAYSAIEAVVKGTFKAGTTSLGLAEGGVGISRYAELVEFIEFGVAAGALTPEEVPETIANWSANRLALPAWIWAAVDELEAAILAGTVVVPTAATLPEMLAVRARFPLTR